jgi:hypothetical protein
VTFSPSGRDSPSTTIRPSRTVPVMIFMVVILPPGCVDLSSAQRITRSAARCLHVTTSSDTLHPRSTRRFSAGPSYGRSSVTRSWAAVDSRCGLLSREELFE